MRTTLTTFDGYPRSDIDIAQIRTTRARIIHLRNDHKALLICIEEGLHAHFAAAAAEDAEPKYTPLHGTTNTNGGGAMNGTTNGSGNASGTTSNNATGASTSGTSTKPAFAIVNTVAPSSPASGAGMRIGDRIVQFGDVDWLNHEKLARVAQVVGRSEGRGIEVVVSRAAEGGEGEVKALRLVPRRDWGGRGTLGCHLKEV